MNSPVGEATCTEDQARELTRRITNALEVTWELLLEAWKIQAWDVLGYSNWKQYVDAEFHASQLGIPREMRAEAVQAMSEEGMSSRAIGAALGIDQKTVVNDRRANEEFSSPDGQAVTEDRRTVTGLDGRVYPAPLRNVRIPHIEVQVGPPKCPPIVMRQEMLDLLQEFEDRGMDMIPRLSMDEQTLMAGSLERLDEALRATPPGA